jgi:hypothetical protein
MGAASNANFLDTLVAGSGNLETWWEQYKSSPAGDPDILYVALGDMATYLVSSLEDRETAGFAEFFHSIEKIIVRGSPEQRKLLVVGLLEAIQNVTLNREMGLDVWKPWIQPTTGRYWSILDRFWRGAISPAEFNALVDPA